LTFGRVKLPWKIVGVACSEPAVTALFINHALNGRDFIFTMAEHKSLSRL
jgi:hypothetical protein